MIVEWIPSWYELDQCIVVGDVDLFYLSNENCFAVNFIRDAYEVKAEIRRNMEKPQSGYRWGNISGDA